MEAARGSEGVHRKLSVEEETQWMGLGRGPGGRRECGLACHLLAALSTAARALVLPPSYVILEKCRKNTTVIFALEIYMSNFNHQNTDT